MMNFKTNGMYFLQSDARVDGLYRRDNNGNIQKEEYKTSINDKLSYLLFNKVPLNPISTSVIIFKNIKGIISVYSSNISGDAITLAKSLKRSNANTENRFEIHNNFIRIFHKEFYQDMRFDKDGNNIESVNYKNDTQEVLNKYKFLFIDWEDF